MDPGERDLEAPVYNLKSSAMNLGPLLFSEKICRLTLLDKNIIF